MHLVKKKKRKLKETAIKKLMSKNESHWRKSIHIKYNKQGIAEQNKTEEQNEREREFTHQEHLPKGKFAK